MTETLDRKHSRTSFLPESDAPAISEKEFSRKLFLKGSGAVVVGLSAAGTAQALNAPNHPNPQKTGIKQAGPGANNVIDSWVHVHPNNTVSIYSGLPEFGQGTPTALTMVTAEEMDLSVSQVNYVTPDSWVTFVPNIAGSNGTPNNAFPTGATTTRGATAAAALAMKRMAAAQWGRPVTDLRVNWGVITVPGTGLRTTYGALMGGKLFRNNTAMGPFTADELGAGLTANVVASPKTNPATHKVMGTNVPQIHIPAIAAGKTIYVQQLQLPGMVHGRIVQPRGQPAAGKATAIHSYDASSVKHIPGVHVVRQGNFLGVIAPKEYDAIQAAAQLKVKWDDTPSTTSNGAMEKAFRNPANIQGSNPASGHTPASQTALDGAFAKKKLSFFIPFNGHIAMAPFGTIIHIHPKHNADGTLLSNKFLTMYSFGQGGAQTLPQAAAAMTAVDPVTFPNNFQNSRARAIWYAASGSYGGSQGRSGDTSAAAGGMAALADKIPALSGKPLRVVYMRWDLTGWDYNGPAEAGTLEWGIDAQGRIVGGQTTGWVAGSPGGQNLQVHTHLGAALPTSTGNGSLYTNNVGGWYTFGSSPGHSRLNHTVRSHYQAGTGIGFFKQAPLRAPNAPQGSFMSEQMIDELAILAKMDPIAFRKLNLTNNTAGNMWRSVLDAVAASAKWKPHVMGSSIKPGVLATGRGVGIGHHGPTPSTPAVIADVTVNRTTGKVTVTHLYSAQNTGYTVNPVGAHSQADGGMVHGLSRVLHEELRFNKVRVTSNDWVSYPILRFKDTPKTTTVILQRKDLGTAGGAGEPTHICVVPAVANAIYDATGVRMTRFPLTPKYVRSMLRMHGVGPTG